MKLKSFIYTALCVSMFAATGCTESEPEYIPAPECQTPEIYFSAANTPTVRALDGDTKFTVNVYRKDKKDAKDYALVCKDQTDASLFTVPTKVSFEAGEGVTSFDVDYVAETLEGVKPYNLTFEVGDGVNTPYALQLVSYTVTYYPWEDVVGPNGEEFGLWKDDILTTFFNLPAESLEWQVKVQKSPAINGLYRVVNPYGTAAFPGIRFTTGSFASGQPLDGKDHYLYFNCADASHIFICDENGDAFDSEDIAVFNTGANVGYGTIYITGLYNMQIADGKIDEAMSLAGTLVNGVIKFPEEAMLIAMANYNNASFYYANSSGAFRVIFPGAEEEKDPDDVWESLGTASYTDAWITPLFGAAETWNVEVEQWKKDPNIYRLVNPYKDGVMIDGWNYEGDKYFVFDATNPQVVLVEEQEIFYDEGDPINGSIEGTNFGYAIMNMVAQPWTEQQVIEAGKNDTFANQEFTFGPGSAMVMFPNTQNPDYVNQIISPNPNVGGKLILNAEAAAAATANRRSAAARKALLGLDKVQPAFSYETRFNTFRGPKFKVNR